MPRLNEGDLLIEAVRIPSASLEGAVAASTQIENLLKTIPEVRLVYCKTGRPEIANDVMGVHQTDVWTMLKPQDEWRPGLTRDALIEEMDKLLTEHVPGVKFGFSQPIEMRVNELVAGVKSDVAALIYGPDLNVLRRLSLEIERVLAQIPGAHDIKNPTAGRLPMLRIKVRRDQLARYGIKASDVLDAVAALGGTTVGTVFEEDKRHPLRVRLPESWRNDPDKIGSIRVVDPQGRPIPLKDLAEIAEEEGPSEVERENVQHRAVVGVNVRGRDIASFVAEAQAAIDAQVKLPARLPSCAGAASSSTSRPPSKRLMIVVPVAMLLIFLLLVQHVPLDAAGAPDLHGRADGGDRRRVRPVPARAAVLDLGRRRLHRPLRRGRAERPGLGQRRRAPAAGRRRAPRGRARGGRRPPAADPHDGPGRRAGLHPDGDRHHPRRRDPAAAGHGRHRRAHHVDPVDDPGAAGGLSLVRPETQGGRGLRRSSAPRRRRRSATGAHSELADLPMLSRAAGKSRVPGSGSRG